MYSRSRFMEPQENNGAYSIRFCVPLTGVFQTSINGKASFRKIVFQYAVVCHQHWYPLFRPYLQNTPSQKCMPRFKKIVFSKYEVYYEIGNFEI